LSQVEFRKAATPLLIQEGWRDSAGVVAQESTLILA